MNIIRVGEDKDFNSITSAIAVALDGDIILIDPGDYSDELTISITKAIHIIGNTKDVVNNYIKIYRFLFSGSTLIKTNSIYIENIVVSSPANIILLEVVSSWDINITINFNKCVIEIDGAVNTYNSYRLTAPNLQLNFINCYQTTRRGYYINPIITSVRGYLKYLDAFESYSYDDYVTVSTEGYGPDYGFSYFKLPTKYYFKGQVTVSGVPVSRRIKAYRRDTDILLATATSDNINGSYQLLTEYAGEHYLICKDEDSGSSYNDLVRGRAVPAVAEYELNYWMTSKKITITISKDIIDEALINFPLCIKLSSMAGENGFDTSIIFDELLIIQHSTRISIQNNNNQQLYCEIVKWDNSTREGVLWVQVPYISATEDTVLFLYYNRELPDNIFNIGYSINTAISHLWGTDAIGVWHMTEDPSDLNIKPSNYKKYMAYGEGLNSSDLVWAPLGTAIDCNQGYLSISSDISTSYVDDMSIISYVKFDDIYKRSTIFCEGGADKGWELGVVSGTLFSSVCYDNNYSLTTSLTLSGINTNNWYFIASTVDKSNNRLTLYLNDYSSYIETPWGINSYIGTNGDNIGSNYTQSPYDCLTIPGVTKLNKFPIEITASGTVASGTVTLLHVDLNSYYDDTGRHSYIPKKTSEVHIEPYLKKCYDASLRQSFGLKDSSIINGYNYIKVVNNLEDFGFDAYQDFTISAWVKNSYYTYATDFTLSFDTTLIGDITGATNTCLSIRKKVQYSNNLGLTSVEEYWQLTIPNDSGSFVVQDENIFITNIKDDTVVFEHVTLVRKDGIITLYLNGNNIFSVFYNGAIPSPLEKGVDIGILILDGADNTDASEDYYALLNMFEVVKGIARWDSDFSINNPVKDVPDTFFSGQIDEIMLYNKKDDFFMLLMSKNLNDNLITYSN
jgi:hypothetical protein